MKRTNVTISKGEKQIIKGLITLALENGWEIEELDAVDLENQTRRITGNNNCEHRDIIEMYIINEIVKLKCKTV